MKSRWSQTLLLGSALAFFTWICFVPRSRILPELELSGSQIDKLSLGPFSIKGPNVFNNAQPFDAYSDSPNIYEDAPVPSPERIKSAELPRRPNHAHNLAHDQHPGGPPAIPEPAKIGVIQPHIHNEETNYSKAPKDDGSGISQELIADFVESIFDLRVTRFERMECPGQFQIGARYESLRHSGEKDSKIKYFITLDLTKVVTLLPRLMGTIMRTIQYLGAQNCGLSIIEGRSGDGTYAVLKALREKLEGAGVRYWLGQSDIDPHGEGQERIGALAVLRNLAMAPLLDEPEVFAEDVITVFSNDVAICPDDILELLFQHIYQNATMACAMDWVYGGDTFYDSWISRSMSGNTFFEIPQDVSWAFNKNMFWDDPISKPLYEHFQPFQVYACWGGMATLDSRPFMDGRLKWRNSTEGECYMGEPTLLSKDLYGIGLGRIMTVPTVNVAYNDADGSRCKKRRGYVSSHVNESESYHLGRDDPQTRRIQWLPPPGQVKCQPVWNVNYWVPPYDGWTNGKIGDRNSVGS